jgi:hypothetical protein
MQNGESLKFANCLSKKATERQFSYRSVLAELADKNCSHETTYNLCQKTTIEENIDQ